MHAGLTQWLQPPGDLILQKNQVHVWRAALELSQARLELLEKTLSPDERERAARFHFDKDRRHFVSGRGILRTILGYYLKVAPDSLRFSYTTYGKPFLTHCEPRSVSFNISHSGGLALFAFSENREVGIDIEQMNRNLDEERIAERFFSPSEVDSLRLLPRHLQNEAFYNCWTRKEAYIKGVGKGLSLSLDSFDVSLHPEQPAKLLAVRNDNQSLSRWTMQALDPGMGYKAAIIAEGRTWELLCWQWGE